MLDEFGALRQVDWKVENSTKVLPHPKITRVVSTSIGQYVAVQVGNSVFVYETETMKEVGKIDIYSMAAFSFTPD